MIEGFATRFIRGRKKIILHSNDDMKLYSQMKQGIDQSARLKDGATVLW